MSYRPLKPHHAPPFRVFRPDEGNPPGGATGVRTLAVPGYRQTRTYTCGFATALMVLRYFEATVPGEELFRRLGTARDGTRQNAIVRELRAAGLRANVRYDADFDRIRREIDRGKPMVGYLDDAEHWLVIYGYGLGPARVYVADPRPQEPCEHLWHTYGARLGGFAIVCSSIDARRTAPARAPSPPPAPPAPVPARPRAPILLGPSPLRSGSAAPDRDDRDDREEHPREPVQLALPLV